jgi:hypothetical protein
MTDEREEAGWWCPSCGAQYVAGVRECADCGVELVPEDPVTDLRVEEGHDLLVYEFEDWPEDQLAALELLLDGEGIPHSWEGTNLSVADAQEAEVDRLIDIVEGRATGGPEA